jgi:hypothetical protein
LCGSVGPRIVYTFNWRPNQEDRGQAPQEGFKSQSQARHAFGFGWVGINRKRSIVLLEAWREPARRLAPLVDEPHHFAGQFSVARLDLHEHHRVGDSIALGAGDDGAKEFKAAVRALDRARRLGLLQLLIPVGEDVARMRLAETARRISLAMN